MAYGNDKRREGGGRKQMHYSPNLVSCLTNAIENRVLAEIEYDSRENEHTKRIIEPMALIHKNRKRHLVGWCTLREDWRSFRLDRIEMVKVTKDLFDRKTDFDVAQFEVDDEFPPTESEDQSSSITDQE